MKTWAPGGMTLAVNGANHFALLGNRQPPVLWAAPIHFSGVMPWLRFTRNLGISLEETEVGPGISDPKRRASTST